MIACVGMLLLAGQAFAAPPKSTEPLGSGGRIPVLIVAGSDAFHDWRRTTPQLRNLLEEIGRFDVRVVEDAEGLGSSAITDRYRTIILNGQSSRSTPALRRNLARYVRRGGGLVAIHWAVDNFSDWNGFTDILGRSWEEGRSAEEHGAFRIAPTTESQGALGILPAWTTPSGEAIHYRLRGKAPVRVFATTQTGAGGTGIPVAFGHDVGRGRTFFTPLGHSFPSRSDPSFQTLIIRAVEWTASTRNR
jgi:hypothetical protein